MAFAEPHLHTLILFSLGCLSFTFHIAQHRMIKLSDSFF